MLTGLLWLAQGASAAPSADRLAEFWVNVQPMLAEHGRTLGIHLGEVEFEALSQDRVVKSRGVGADGVQRVDSAAWMPLDAWRIWLAIHDDQHNDLNAGLDEEVVSLGDKGTKVLYQSVDLPIPFVDRFWVIQIANNPEIYEASGNRVLERTWTLHPEGRDVLSPALRDESKDMVWTPVNNGAWLVIPIGDQSSLVLYRVESDVGGIVPDVFVGRFTASRVDDLMRRMQETAKTMATHYTGDHRRIVLPDGKEIPTWSGGSP